MCMNVDGRREGLFKPPGLIEKLQAMKGRVKQSCVCVCVCVCVCMYVSDSYALIPLPVPQGHLRTMTFYTQGLNQRGQERIPGQRSRDSGRQLPVSSRRQPSDVQRGCVRWRASSRALPVDTDNRFLTVGMATGPRRVGGTKWHTQHPVMMTRL